MLESIAHANIAVIGGGKRCHALLRAVFGEHFDGKRPVVIGVAEINEDAAGVKYAREKGIFTTHDYTALFELENLDLIIELTQDDSLGETVRKAKPADVRFADHYEGQTILDALQIRAKKAEMLEAVRKYAADAEKTEALFGQFSDFVLDINQVANTYSRKIGEKLAINERTLSQIIQGSTIPTFVIDTDHRLTHWNTAMERLTGLPSREMVGTDRQWSPFYDSPRPSMADVILDQIDEAEIRKLYGSKWRKSALIEGAYEAENFFPNLGDGGKWCWFTAAPIKTPEGELAGAIETIWDKTEEKKAEQERERHTKELASSERAMSQIIQGSTIPTFVIGRDHAITHWNKAMERLSGFSSTEMIGTNRQWAPFYEKERATMADVILDQVDEREIKKLYGTKWRKSALINGAFEAEDFFPDMGDGGTWCWFTAAPIKTAEGEVTGAIETIWDTTDDKKAEQERERHTKELATFCSIYATLSGPLELEGRINAAIEETANIFMADAVCIFILNPDGTFQLTYTHGQSETLCSQNRVAGLDSTISRVAREGKISVFVDAPDDGDGESALLRREGLKSLVYIPILDKQGLAFGVIRVASKQARHFDHDDIHALELIGNRISVAIENSQLQEEIRRRADFQAKLIGSSNDGIVATDKEWKVVIFNPAAENIFGYAASDVVERADIRDIYPEKLAGLFDEVMAAGNNTWKLPWRETSIVSKAGEEIPVRFSGTILHKKKQVMGSVAFFQDLREIKRLEAELVGAERLAAIGQTVAGMAHCIKNILHGLKGGSYLIDIGIKKNNTDKLQSGWEMMQRNIGRTSGLMQDLLSYSKGREPEHEACMPNEIAEDVCELLKDNAARGDIEIAKDFSPEIGEVAMDPITTHRCLLNLVTNAVDACIYDDEAEDKAHRVTVKTTLEDGNFVRFDVTDNGSGMDEDVKSKLFASFFSTKGAKGTGLGLLVTRKLIEEHKGNIWVESKLGEGTTFGFRLPFETVNG